jgi:hypothetical protein
MPEAFFALGAFFVVWMIVKDRSIAQEREIWVAERRELLNRIQHPEVMPRVQEFVEYELPEPDEINLVGVVIDE